MLSEDELIAKCLQGNRKAQKQLYTQYSALMFSICCRYMPRKEEAEDALITGFTAIFTKLDTYKKEGSFEGWMKRVMINNAISMIRANAKFQNTEQEEVLENIETGAPSVLNHLEAKEIIAQIQSLPDGYRTVFNLYAIEGYSYEEIAKQLDVNIGTVRSQLSKARKSLQEKLTRYKDDFSKSTKNKKDDH